MGLVYWTSERDHKWDWLVGPVRGTVNGTGSEIGERDHEWDW